MVSRYSFVRYRWTVPVEFDMLEKEYSSFKITKLIHEKVAIEVSLYKDKEMKSRYKRIPFRHSSQLTEQS